MVLKYNITNHVISVKTSAMINLKEAYSKLRYGHFSPLKFSALTLKFTNPNVTFILFSTGCATIMGTNSYYTALYAILKVKEVLKFKILGIKLTNIVAKFSLKESYVDIQALFKKTMKNSACDETLFPSCTYAVPDSTIKANFFKTGNVVVAGCTTRKEIKATIEYLMNEVYAKHIQI